MNLKYQPASSRISTPQQNSHNNQNTHYNPNAKNNQNVFPNKFQYMRVDKSLEIRRNTPKISLNKKTSVFNDHIEIDNKNNIITQLSKPDSSTNNLAKSANLS